MFVSSRSLDSNIYSSQEKIVTQLFELLRVNSLSPHHLIDTSEFTRLKYAIQWSVAPWVEGCYGKIVTIPDGFSTPQSVEQLKEIFRFADVESAKIIINGYENKNHFINSVKTERAVVLIHLNEMNYIQKIEGSKTKYLLGPSLTIGKLKAYFDDREIQLKKIDGISSVQTVYEIYRNYLSGKQKFSFPVDKLLVYLHVETPPGKLILESSEGICNGTSEHIKSLVECSGAPFGILSGICVDLHHFLDLPIEELPQVGITVDNEKETGVIFDFITTNTYPFENIDDSIGWFRDEFKLTDKEAQVCYLLLKGKGDKEIARELSSSYWTVRTHVNKILYKLEISSRLEVPFKVFERNKVGK